MLEDEVGSGSLEKHVELLRAEELETQGAEQAVAVAPRLDDLHFHCSRLFLRRAALSSNSCIFIIVFLDLDLSEIFRHCFCVLDLKFWKEKDVCDFAHAIEVVIQTVVSGEGIFDVEESERSILIVICISGTDLRRITSLDDFVINSTKNTFLVSIITRRKCLKRIEMFISCFIV